MTKKIVIIDKISSVGHIQILERYVNDAGKEEDRVRYQLLPDSDISGQPDHVKNICNEVWTEEIRSNWEALKISNSGTP